MILAVANGALSCYEWPCGYRLPSTSCTPTTMKGITETARTTFETSRLRYSVATRWEFRRKSSVIAKKDRKRAPSEA